MKTNPFTVARGKVATIGECIDALIEAFSLPGSADTMGEYILERALEKVKERRPERQVEWDEVMGRLNKMFPPAIPEETLSQTYANSVEAAHLVEGHFKKTGETFHSAGSNVWVLNHDEKNYSMTSIPSSNIPRYLRDRETVTVAEVYADLFQI